MTLEQKVTQLAELLAAKWLKQNDILPLNHILRDFGMTVIRMTKETNLNLEVKREAREAARKLLEQR